MNREITATLRVNARTGNLAPLNTVQRKLDQVYRQAEAFNKRQSRFGRAQQAMYGQLAMLGRYAWPLAAGYMGYKALESASDMEDALFAIQKKTGATEDQLADLRSQIKGMARDVPVSMSEIAAAFERGGAAGIPIGELKEFAELTVKVADAWDMTAENVANAFAGFEAGMGIPREELEAFADLINYLADSGIADESDIVDFIDRAGASLKNFGLAKEEIAAYGAAMLNLKIPAEVAARAMDTLTGKLIAPSNLSPKARGALKEVVGDLKTFAKDVETDAGGALDKFWARLQKFSNADRARILGQLLGEGFDDEVMRLSAGLDELNRNLDATAEKSKYLGSISEAAANKTKLWSSQWQIFKNNLEAFSDDWGAPVLKKINEGMQDINAFVDEQAEISEGRQKARALGETEEQVRSEYRRRYRAAHDGDMEGEGDSYRQDLAALGRGEVKTLFERLMREENSRKQEKRDLAAVATMDGADTRREAIEAAAHGIPLPSAKPTDMSEKEQRALYGRGQAIMMETLADLRIRTNEALNDFLRDDNSQFSDIEERYKQAGIGVSEPADNDANDEIDSSEFKGVLDAIRQILTFDAPGAPPIDEGSTPIVGNGRSPVGTPGDPLIGDKPSDRPVSSALQGDGMSLSDAFGGLYDWLTGAGDEAGQAIGDAGARAGEAVRDGGSGAADAIRQAMIEGARQAGAEIARQIASGAANIKINVSAPGGGSLPGTDRNTGRSKAGDIKNWDRS